MAATFDFIVVGAGASGSVVASRIAHASSRPSVLLLEAGGSNASAANQSSAVRFEAAFAPNSPLNWNYKTIPQQQLNGQEIDYSRGKGLGGTTAINFCGWVVGPKDDYDEWGRLVDDESFSWPNVKNCLDRITHVHPEIPDLKLKKYIDVNPDDHTTSGPLHVTYGDSWIPNLSDIYVAAEQSGHKTNPDVNSGDPMGMGMGSVCIYNDQRLTASTAYLTNPPANLSIITNATVANIILDGKRAVGVKCIDGKSFYATKEVIVSGGALNSPQILLLSGIGPEEELSKHGIPVTHELPMVGKNLQDHCFSSVGIVMKREETAAASAPQVPTPMGWFKLPTIANSEEFYNLPERMRTFLDRPTVPSYEIASHTPPTFLSYTVKPGESFLGAMCLIMNPQSRGTVTLQSNNPAAAPLVNPNFLSHPYDRRIMIDGLRETMRLLSAPVFAASTVETLNPKDLSDEGVWNYVRKNTYSSWHMSCTTAMGTSSETACVDSDFRVFGLEALRVVDLGVCPFVPNNHTQSTAYVIGEIAAEKLIKEYGL